MSDPSLLDVLVVDDEPKICQLLLQILAAKGYTVRVAHDGLEALAEFQQQPADVVVTDIKMPRLTGLELITELKRMDPLINVVVITAYPTIEGAVEAMRCGASDFITKPFNLAQIQAVLYGCHQRLQLQRQLRKESGESALLVEELQRRLAQLNETRSQLLAGISNGLQNPLGMMGETLYAMSDGQLGTLGPDQQDALRALLDAYERLQQRLKQLGEVLATDPPVLNRELVSAQDVLEQAIGNIRSKASVRSIEITCEWPEASMAILVDPDQLRSAFVLLLDNAIKFNKDSGRVTVRLSKSDESLNIEIEDTGIGIPEEARSQIWAPFYQGDQRFSRAYGGAGIGLPLARRIIEAHGGTINCLSEEGEGTKFKTVLPKLQVAPRQGTAPGGTVTTQ